MTESTNYIKRFEYSFASTRLAKTIVCIVILLVLVCICCAGIAFFDSANVSDFSQKLAPPSLSHPFGTDQLGRDMFVRTISGLSMSIVCGLVTTLCSCAIAIVIALISASNNRIANFIVDLMCDITIGIPHIVLLILISFALGKGAFGMTVAIALTHWPTLSRLLRAEILKVKASDYYKISLSCSPKLKTSLKHIIVAILPQIVVGCALCFPHAILHESTLTFLGFGFSPETPAIGIILSDSLSFMSSGYWWLGVLPGFCLIVAVLAFRFLFSSIKDLALKR